MLCALLIVAIVLLVRLCGADAIDYPESAEVVARADSAMVDTVERAAGNLEKELPAEISKGRCREMSVDSSKHLEININPKRKKLKSHKVRIRQPLDEPVRSEL